MSDTAQKWVQSQAGQQQLTVFASRLHAWLLADLDSSADAFTESRARALLLASDNLDDPTRNSFTQLVAAEPALRAALYDLLSETGLSENEDVAVLSATVAQSAPPATLPEIPWLALAVAAFAWRNDFLLDQLDPGSPPTPYSPAGQVLKRAAQYVRQQVQRTATERDKLGRKLAFNAQAGGTPTLDTLNPESGVAPLPPYYRSPIPVNYPEYSRETLYVEGDESSQETPPERGPAISIQPDDLTDAPTPPATQPAIRIDASQLEPPRPAPSQPSPVVMPDSVTSANVRPQTRSSRRRRSGEATKMTKLRVEVKDNPDGSGLYGLQVRVSSTGIKRHVAGTTNQDGVFTCELPVPVNSGLTYDVDVTWSRDFGSETERKSITLNADRTMFTLPFYRTLKA